MDSFEIPKYVTRVLSVLSAEGYAACLVGGCVRDMLLGKRPHDWDVCTSARPEEIMAVFPRTRPTGLQHGTVTVLAGGRGVEVTTFRAEGGYADHRHPDHVTFVRDLERDLSRRDFTVNAMAMDLSGHVTDPFGGQRDLRCGVIRCVGDPERRFEEDALRMLRALRFAARFGFPIEDGTMAALREKAALAATLAPERVRVEMEQMLLSPRPELMQTAIDAGLLDAYLSPAPVADSLRRLTRLPRQARVRWCALSVLLEWAGAIPSVEDFLIELRLDRQTTRCAAICSALLWESAPETAAGWKRQLRCYDVEPVECAARCRDALHGGRSLAALKSVLASGECWSLKDLAVDGEILSARGLRGREIGQTLNRMLDHVIEHPEDNDRERLLTLWEEQAWTAGNN